MTTRTEPSDAGDGAPGAKPENRRRASPSVLLVWFLVAISGVFAGVGAFTFRYAEGFSYLSTDPKACVNCHIMRPQYDGWQKASHHAVARCVDCHLPQDFFGKYFTKAENGWRHSKEFTAQTFAEPIKIQPRALEILQENCVRCHETVVDVMNAGHPGGPGGLECVHCHVTVGHGDHVGLGGPYRPGELELTEKAKP